jgi:hypothetical protein
VAQTEAPPVMVQVEFVAPEQPERMWTSLRLLLAPAPSARKPPVQSELRRFQRSQAVELFLEP